MREVIALLRQGDVKAVLDRYGDVALAALVVSIVGMMIVPLPTFLLDLLITFNITLAVVILLVALYVQDALRFASFPTLLLITTLYRLALNVSATRLILLKANAGEVIRSFGEFVVGGNFVVGAVVFLILTIIQFVVIAKGSERVAEVAARFTLDAMPGKQMAIDADLRAGAFDLDEARRRRAALQRESQLYGSMDGAMKFVKGDAIAGIIITGINIVGGLIIGVAMRGLELSDAARIYTILTIGDGLVSQIPALLISTAAGMVVTRVASEDEGSNLGKDIGMQLLQQPRALAIAAVLLALLAFVGLPRVPFLALAVLTGGVAFALFRRGKAAARAGEDLDLAAADAVEGRPELQPGVTPVALEVSEALTPLIDADTAAGRLVGELIPRLRESLFAELGVHLPGVRVRGHAADLPAGGYRIRLQEIPMAEGVVPPGRVLCAETAERLAGYGISAEPATLPGENAPAAWVALADRDACEQAGVVTYDAAGAVLLHLAAVLTRYAYEFVGIQETQVLLDQFEHSHPALVREITPKLCSPHLIADVLRRLVEEQVSIRDLRTILQALAEWAPVEKDPVVLTEYVRTALRRYLTHKHAGGSGTLVVHLLDGAIEDAVRGAVQRTSGGSYLALEPEVSREILDAVRREVGETPPGAPAPVILTQMEIRRYVRRLIEVEHPQITVLSYQELAPELNIQPVGRIRLTAD
ncbi:MAG: type III secretion system export apparatus subunit SctV [Deltaproteobacteria bacterium]|nr:type III secretion system export apparatus subunit SctV [Deltaproteobacteria bacterium]